MASLETYYTASFVGRDPKDGTDVRWDLAIEGKPRDVYRAPMRLDMAYDGCAEVEWNEVNKIGPVQGSALTLTLISPGDRTLTDLYNVEPASIFVTLMRNGELWWIGALDPELYAEPYTSAGGYEVVVTASDFGVLDRLDFDGTGIISIQDIIDGCIARMYPLVPKPMLNASFRSTKPSNLSELYVDSSNFYDEDGEPMTWREVLEAVLQPMALRIVQRCGHLFLYDINTLASPLGKVLQAQEVWWSSDDAELSIDETYDKVTLTLSPYVPDAISADIEEDRVLADVVPEGVCSEADLTDEELKKFVPAYSFYIAHGEADKKWGGMTLGSGAQFFRLRGGKNNCVGVVWEYPLDAVDFKLAIMANGTKWRDLQCRITPQVHSYLESPLTQPCTLFPRRDFDGSIINFRKRNDGVEIPQLFDGEEPMITMSRFYVPKNESSQEKWSLREILTNDYYSRRKSTRIHISAEMLLDVAPSPFQEWLCSSWMRSRFNIEYAFVPCRLLLYDAQGNVTHHWQNVRQIRKIAESKPSAKVVDKPEKWNPNRPDNVLEQTMAWEPGEGEWGDMWLAFYASSYTTDEGSSRYACFWTKDQASWVCNRPVRTNDKLGQMVNDNKEFMEYRGEYVPLPPVAGWVELQIGVGILPGFQVYDPLTVPLGIGVITHQMPSDWIMVDFDKEANSIANLDVCNYLRWQMFRNLSIKEVVLGEDGTMASAKEGADDIEYSAWLNRAAEDSLDIDTTVGTPGSMALPTARCRIMDGNGNPVEKFTRGGVTDSLERLLIGTVYSQYAARHNVLSGECATRASGLPLYTDAAAPDEVYLGVSEVAQLITGTSTVKLVQIEQDNYQGPITTQS